MSTSDPISTIRSYIDAFNKGDQQRMGAMFATQSSILDGMAPHLWLGPKAAFDWYRDVLAEGERHHASGYHVTLEEPLHNDTTDDRAYVVVPASMSFKVHDKQVIQNGAFLTVALHK